jgi:hypothetical protein
VRGRIKRKRYSLKLMEKIAELCDIPDVTYWFDTLNSKYLKTKKLIASEGNKEGGDGWLNECWFKLFI